ncbi:MAG: iron-containing redox enzyme family protein, partial [Acidobacteriota bacterium]
MIEHPLLSAADLPTPILHEFAFHQYADSILWIPMLAQMKGKAARSQRLRDAIADNIAHEAGLHATSHVALAVTLMRSLGIRHLDELPTAVLAESAQLWLSDEFAAFGEPEIAGFLLVAETLVPVMFAALAPSFRRLGADTTYFDEHVHVDTDEHATWMAEAVEDVLALYGPSAAAAIDRGMADAWDETIAIPEQLWRSR